MGEPLPRWWRWAPLVSATAAMLLVVLVLSGGRGWSVVGVPTRYPARCERGAGSVDPSGWCDCPDPRFSALLAIQ